MKQKELIEILEKMARGYTITVEKYKDGKCRRIRHIKPSLPAIKELWRIVEVEQVKEQNEDDFKTRNELIAEARKFLTQLED